MIAQLRLRKRYLNNLGKGWYFQIVVEISEEMLNYVAVVKTDLLLSSAGYGKVSEVS